MIKSYKYFTSSDEKNGYELTRNSLKLENTEDLTEEYLQLTRHMLNNIIGHNAQQMRDLVALELIINRNIKGTIPRFIQYFSVKVVFDPIPVMVVISDDFHSNTPSLLSVSV